LSNVGHFRLGIATADFAVIDIGFRSQAQNGITRGAAESN